MKIRTHPVVLVCSALLPAFIFVACLTVWFWSHQRTAIEARLLDRVRALSIAVDTEIDASVRVLSALKPAPELRRPGLARRPADLHEFSFRAQRVVNSQPHWSGFSLADAEGKRLLTFSTAGPSAVSMDVQTVRRAVATGQPATSGLVQESPGNYGVQIAVPVLLNGDPAYVLVVNMDTKMWLDLLSRFPVASNAAMTLNDDEGFIIARTLNNERWVGKRSGAPFWNRTIGKNEGAFVSRGLEGQTFYSAFVRSTVSGWLVGTGVPLDDLEASLRDSTLTLVGGALLAAALAIWLAVVFGRQISRPISTLAATAEALARRSPSLPRMRGISEVEDVASAFERAGALLHQRDLALNSALAAEQKARAEAEAANRGKDEFLAMLGHELRNPLSAISNAFLLANAEGAGPVHRARSKEVIERQLGNLKRLVDDLLDVARVTTGKIELQSRPLDLPLKVRQTADTLQDAHRLADHVFELRLQEVWVLGDETRIEQIICNLIENSIKYTPARGRIQITTRAESGKAILEVKDTGSGIAPELLPRVFELFAQGERTLARSNGGLGMGLTLVRRLVHLHGGTVTATSEGVGKGALFTVRLPMIERPKQLLPAPKNESNRVAPQRILIVEDNVDSLETLKSILEHQGHEVIGEYDGPTGAARAISSRPDICIVDIGLPGFDGYELARRVRAAPSGKCIRLIALTGYGQDEDRARAKEAGFDECLVKPVDLETLQQALVAR